MLEDEHPRRRRVALWLIGVRQRREHLLARRAQHTTCCTTTSRNGHELIISGVLIWLTNFLIFALWYWEIDRGGPGKRAAGNDGRPTSCSRR